MKTNAEILETWDDEGQYAEWWAADNYDPVERRVHRLYVGDAATARRIAGERAAGIALVDYDGNPCEPGEFGPAKFYRATVIDAKAARDYFLCLEMHDAPAHSNELIAVKQAADELGIRRQSAYELVDRGVLPAEECDGLRVGRYSVALRNAAKPARQSPPGNR